jgi:fructokinase
VDVNLRKDCFTEDAVSQSMVRADVVKLNESEAAAVAQIVGLPALPLPDLAWEMARRCALDSVVVTLAERGAFAAGRDAEPVYVPGYRVPVVDSLGSGDAFSAGFVHQRLRGATLEEACAFGNLMGALVASTRGGTAPIAKDQISRFARDGTAERIVDPVLSKYWKR